MDPLHPIPLEKAHSKKNSLPSIEHSNTCLTIDFVRWNCLPALFPDTPCSITLCNFEQWRSRQRLGANGGEIVRPLSADDLLSQTMQKGCSLSISKAAHTNASQECLITQTMKHAPVNNETDGKSRLDGLLKHVLPTCSLKGVLF
ncbi:hypothetical protein CDAR_587861 [Caerostris darwini]|uniref:Uncharacterized protein n=1 Tax=Caerostris darwini TaxID=1538125 RepID=A0AAV4TH84_9ARAC|nr:hypothetical protein CDAR_587861 [Caerostris darwini]